MSYVKGHSGDPDNERVDRIAVAFSHNAHATLTLQGSSELLPAKAAPEAPSTWPKPAAAVVELADRLAQGGYSLSLLELAQLVKSR